ncbi:MAG: hypothetical protein AB8B56_03160, partial [Crocinitomicaceae bacterium]
MAKPLQFFLLLFTGFYGNNMHAQSFVNGDLDGIVGFTSAPTGWSQIPFNDPTIQAGQSAGLATSDILGVNGPS